VEYDDREVSPTAEQLKALVVGPNLLVTGPCPRCTDGVSLHLAEGPAGAIDAPVPMRCNCEGRHEKRPEHVPKGCGAWWVCQVVSADGQSFALAAAEDEAVREALVTYGQAVADAEKGSPPAAEVPAVRETADRASEGDGMADADEYDNREVSPTAEQLKALVVGPNRLVNGPCPRCTDGVRHLLEFDAIVLAKKPAGPIKAPQLIRCNCTGKHEKRPENVPKGCGAWWVCQAISPDGQSFVLAAEPDEAVREALVKISQTVADTEKGFPPAAEDQNTREALVTARQAVAGTQTGFATAAEKWIPGVSAITGIAGLAAVVVNRDALATLQPSWRFAAFVLVVFAIACAATAVFTAYLAAFGLGRRLDLSTHQALIEAAKLVDSRKSRSARRLTRAVVLAGLSVVGLLAALGVLLFGTTGSAPTVRVAYYVDGDTNRPAEMCGRLLGSENGMMRISVTDGAEKGTKSVKLADATSVKAVANCGGGSQVVR
jgi:hypothetical protein